MYVFVSVLVVTVISLVDSAANTKICSDVLWGSFIVNEPYLADGMNRTAYYDKQLQRSSQIVHWYANWGDGSGDFGWNVPHYSAIAKNFTSVGNALHHPMLTWQPWGAPFQTTTNTYSLPDIAAGKHDTYIDTWVNGVKKLNYPFYIRFAHEMDGNWYPWGQNNGNTPPQYIAAWRHIVDRFRNASVTNVQFVWCPNNSNNGGTDQTLYFPGDAYVDWICLDAYAESSKYSFASTITTNCNPPNPYQRLTAISTKPMMIGEWGVKEPTGNTTGVTTKAQWYTDAANAVATQFPRIKAMVYFNQYEYVWDSTSASLNGAKSAFGSCTSVPTFTAGPTAAVGLTTSASAGSSASNENSGTKSKAVTTPPATTSDVGSTSPIVSGNASSDTGNVEAASWGTQLSFNVLLIVSTISISIGSA